MQIPPDYSRYNDSQLHNLYRQIDSQSNPAQYAAVQQEIARRAANPKPYEPRGFRVMLLGIIGLFCSVCCPPIGFLSGLAAYLNAEGALKLLNASNITTGKELSSVRIGRVCGIIAMLLAVFFQICIVVYRQMK
jgi:hypothetical protein